MTQSSFREQTPKSFLQSLYEESSTQKQRLGCTMRIADGREFVYAKCGATNLAVGVLSTAPAPIANKVNVALTNVSAGNNVVVFANIGDPGVTANDYAEGYLHINDATGEGYTYKVKSHATAAANAALTVNLYDPVRLATSSGEATLVKNPFNGIVIGAATVAGDNPLVGVPIIPLTANYYGWIQTRGPCSVLTLGTVVLGAQTIQAANGAVAPASANDIITLVGRCLVVNANTEYSLIDLRL